MNIVKNGLKKLSFVLILGIFFGSALTASAQTVISASMLTNTPCTNLSVGLWHGKYDTTTGGQVTLLQNFLHAQGYLSVNATGYFGPLTAQAVKSFQRENGLKVDGFVGVQTRAHIYAKACTIIGSGPTSATPVIINGFAPYQGTVGSTVTLPGSGFTTDSILHFGIGAISIFTINNNGTAITFTVPSYLGPYCKPGNACPLYAQVIGSGTYPIYIENSNGSSNIVSFTVIGI